MHLALSCTHPRFTLDSTERPTRPRSLARNPREARATSKLKVDVGFGMKGLPDRKRNRLPGYDYSRGGWYYVRICTHGRKAWFGVVEDGRMCLNEAGRVAEERWQWLGQHYGYVDLDTYVVMPNHIHALIRINNAVGNGRDRSEMPTQEDGTVTTVPYRVKSLSGLVGAFKTTSSKRIHESGIPGFRWQKSFYDSIVRKSDSLTRVRRYIQDNPKTWATDTDNPEYRNPTSRMHATA